MGTTYVYLTTSVDDTVNLTMARLGPSELNAKLTRSSVASHVSKEEIEQIPRTDNDGGAMYVMDTQLLVGSDYIASLQVLLRGHGNGSMIWWRWRTVQDVGYWLTDHKSHNVRVNARGRTYEFRVTGHGTFGYDDIYLELLNL